MGKEQLKSQKSKRAVFHADLPYEKFRRMGPGALTESELLAIILQTGTREKNAVQLAAEVLERCAPAGEGLLGLYNTSVEELMEVKGIGAVKAVKLKCLTELSMRINRASASAGLVFRRSSSVAEYYMEQLRHRDTECLILISLDAKCRMLSEKKLSEGSARTTVISPREIFLEALRARAVNMILVHNHPSGDPTPSEADIELTLAVDKLGREMKILLLDHVIIGDNRYISFKELGYLT